MHVSKGGVHDLLGAIVTRIPGRLLSDALASDPVHCGRQGLSLRAAEADKLGSEVTPGGFRPPWRELEQCQGPGLLPVGLPGARIQSRLLQIQAGSLFCPNRRRSHLVQSHTPAPRPE